MEQTEGKSHFTIPQLLELPFLTHGFGTRLLTQGDIQAKPEWRSFSSVFLKQIHSDIFFQVNSVPEEDLVGDALLTQQPNLLLSIKTADCLPILVVSRDPKAVAAIHSGWKGTCLDLTQKVIRAMKKELGCSPSSLQAALGPAIGLSSYEVGEDVRECFEDFKIVSQFFRPHPLYKNKHYFDLRGSNLFQLLDAGLKEENIFSLNFDTFTDLTFYSYRREKEETGRMISFIGMIF